MAAKTTSYMTLTARVPRALGEQIKARAERAGTSPSETIRALIARAMSDTPRDTGGPGNAVGPAQIDRIERLVELAARCAAETSEGARAVHRLNKRDHEMMAAMQYAAAEVKRAKEGQG